MKDHNVSAVNNNDDLKTIDLRQQRNATTGSVDKRYFSFFYGFFSLDIRRLLRAICFQIALIMNVLDAILLYTTSYTNVIATS